MNAKLESLVGEIYPLCKDQHGCRYLQQKLDERKESSITLIFDEVKDHMSELMTGTSQVNRATVACRNRKLTGL